MTLPPRIDSSALWLLEQLHEDRKAWVERTRVLNDLLSGVISWERYGKQHAKHLLFVAESDEQEAWRALLEARTATDAPQPAGSAAQHRYPMQGERLCDCACCSRSGR